MIQGAHSHRREKVFVANVKLSFQQIYEENTKVGIS